MHGVARTLCSYLLGELELIARHVAKTAALKASAKSRRERTAAAQQVRAPRL